MSKIKFKLEGVDDARKKFEEINSSSRQEIIRQTSKSSLNIEGEAKKNVAVDIGRARASIQTRFENSGLTGVIFSDVEYSKWIEFGRPAGKQPPTEALEGWAKRHGLEGLEYIIARAIGERGLPPRPFLLPAFENERKKYFKEVRSILKRLGDK